MNYVLFAKTDKFSGKKSKQNIKNTRKNTAKVKEFCQSGKVGTM